MTSLLLQPVSQRSVQPWHASSKPLLPRPPAPPAANRFDVLAGLRPGGTVLINAPWKTFEEVEAAMPPKTKTRLAALRPKVPQPRLGRASVAVPAVLLQRAHSRAATLGVSLAWTPRCKRLAMVAHCPVTL